MYRYTQNSNRKTNDTWVYMNGELYHAGIKGMKWGKHLPGTTWWKKLSGEFRRGVTTYENEQRRANASGIATINYPANSLGNGKAYQVYGPNAQSGVLAGNKQTADSMIEPRKKPNSIGYKAKMYGTVAGRMAKRRIDKAGKAISTGAKKAAEFAKNTVSDLREKASAGKAKAKEMISNFANKSVKSIKTAAARTQNKVYNFLGKLGIMKKVYNERRPGGGLNVNTRQVQMKR